MPRNLGLAALLLLLACDGGTASLDWSLVFGAGVDESDASRIHAWIRAGDCGADEGMEVYRERFAASESAPLPPRLTAGTYAFRAEASNDACEVFARGCVSTDLPAAIEEIETVMESVTIEAACPVEACVAGECNGEADAGLPDSAAPDSSDSSAPDAADSGDADTGPLDTGPLDTGPLDTGPPDPCDELFGVAPGYIHCVTRDTECEFYVDPFALTSCNDICIARGQSCNDAFDEGDGADICERTGNTGCDSMSAAFICICTR